MYIYILTASVYVLTNTSSFIVTLAHSHYSHAPPCTNDTMILSALIHCLCRTFSAIPQARAHGSMRARMIPYMVTWA